MDAADYLEFADAAARWFAGTAGPARLRARLADPAADGRKAWRTFREFGLADAIADAPDAAARAHILAHVALQAGRLLYTGPLAEGLGPDLFGLTIAGAEPLLAALPAPGTAMPALDAADGLLNGTLHGIPHADSGTRWLVAASGTHGPLLLDIAPAPRTVRVTLSRQADGTANARIDFSGHPVARTHVVAAGPVVAAMVGEWRDLLALAGAARLLGAAEEATLLAREYLKVRTQFGRTLASFQVLQHQAVNHYADLQLARALLDQVLAHWHDAVTRRTALPALKAFTATAALEATKNAVQMFGATGFSIEADAGLYLRHALTLAYRDGDPLEHRRAFAALGFDFLG